MTIILLYLLEASAYLLVFALAYQGLFSRLTHFSWMRAYLISGLVLSLVLPLLPTPTVGFALWNDGGEAWQPTAFLFTASEGVNSPVVNAGSETSIGISGMTVFLWLLMGVYGAGVLYYAYRFGYNVYKVSRLIAKYPKQWEEGYCKVSVPSTWPAFSFLRYIFLSRDTDEFTDEDQQCIIAHELAHVRQYHTYDRLFFEVVSIFFWFHPRMRYLKEQLQEVQEYLADWTTSGHGPQKQQYAQLLLKLATEVRPVSLAAGFSGKQISRRIIMLSKPRSRSEHKWWFALMIPVVAGVFLLSGCLEEPSPDTNSLDELESRSVQVEKDVRIRRIIWEGNTVYNDDALTAALKLKAGDLYDSLVVNERLNYNPDGSDIVSMYMDRGYLFFGLKVQKEKVGDNLVDLLMEVYEGEIVRIEDIFIRGNQGVSKEKILEEVPLEKGEVFKRFKLIAAHKAIAKMGYFDPEQVIINPIPHPEQGTVDIEFVLTPKQ